MHQFFTESDSYHKLTRIMAVKRLCRIYNETMLQIERMMSTELDPVFVKALKLLQSRSKDSYFQLRQMYDEAVAHRRAEAAIKRVTRHFLHSLRATQSACCFFIDLKLLVTMEEEKVI